MTDKKSAANGLNLPQNVEVSRLASGKFRRYHQRNWRQRVLDLKTVALNLRDVWLVIIGTMQAVFLLLTRRPDAVLLNGGAIGLPVAWGCRLLRVPYAVHESDLVPGLANRLAAKHAQLVMFGFEPDRRLAEQYQSKMTVTGIQLRSEFKAPPTRDEARQKLNISENEPVVLITGGSLGGRRLVGLVAAQIDQLVKQAQIIHITGPANVDTAQTAWNNLNQSQQPRYQIIDYVREGMIYFMAAADVAVTRAGATTLAELAQVGVPTIIVPNPRLPGGHQIKNAKWFSQRGAAITLSEDELSANPTLLNDTITSLLEQPDERKTLSESIKALSNPDATQTIAQHLLQLAAKDKSK